MLRLCALTLACLPAVALAQDARKFNVHELEKEFAPLPVFAPKQGAVDNEVIVARDRSADSIQAIYVVRAELKKVLEFYASKLSIKAKQDGDEALGTVKYTFAPKVKGKVLIATLSELDDRSGVQIALLRRTATEDDPPLDSEP
jgi:hypothetical protein